MQIEMIATNAVKDANVKLVNFLIGKYFVSNTNLEAERILIKNITRENDNYIITTVKNITVIEEQFISFMRLFENYYNQGYRLEFP
jgi:hypothetical protein